MAFSPYSPDSHTLYLFHLDEPAGASTVVNAVVGGFSGISTNSAGITQTDVLGGGAGLFDGAAALSQSRALGIDANASGGFTTGGADRFSLATLLGTNHAFTMEALVKTNTSDLTTNAEIWSTDSSGTRGFLFRINTAEQLEYNGLGFGGGNVTVPLTDLQADTWYHVALTYTEAGQSSGQGLFTMYWTRADGTQTQAQVLHSWTAAAVTPNFSSQLVLGNEGRATMDEGFPGWIDEARWSNVARAAGNFIFADPNDLDADGLPDDWEIDRFTTIEAQDGEGDPDADGWSNFAELAADMNPVIANVGDPHLTASDALTTPYSSSFDAGLHWNDAAAPAGGHFYLVAGLDLRSPAVTADYTFAGDKLVLSQSGATLARFLWKNTGALTFPVLCLDGVQINQAANGGSTVSLNGNVVVTRTSELWANNGSIVVNAALSGSGNLNITGGNPVTFTGSNTWVGRLNVTGNFILGNGTSGGMTFRPEAGGDCNAITGTGGVTLNGTFHIDLSDAGTAEGASWMLVSAGSLEETYGAAFTVADFTSDGASPGSRKWHSNHNGTIYQFDEGAGELKVVPMPVNDSDFDGLDDLWEDSYFGNDDGIIDPSDLSPQNGAGDPDSDGASNTEEQSAGSDPTSGASFPDTDHDGLYDGWETAWFGSISAQDGGGDPDADGFDNAAEFAGKSSPADKWSVPDDVDGDGLSDAWEDGYWNSLEQSAYDDGDNDGYDNLAEQRAGTSPVSAASHPGWRSPRVDPALDSTVTTNARLFASNATYGRAVNGISFQDQILHTFDGFQYTAWYDNTALTVFIARRAVDGTGPGPWEVVNTGSSFQNGPSDAHNVISIGVCATDGTLHMSWDHHGHTLRYRKSVIGLCTTNKAAWGAGMMNPEQDWLVAAGQTISTVTYPMFVGKPDGGLVFQWRYGSSGSGDNMLAAYDGATHAWSAPIQFDTRGGGTYTEGTFSDSDRNAYLNGFDFAADGSMHITWTYREGAGTSNHDICYAYSMDDGATWRNNSGELIADTNLGQRVNLNSPGILVKRKDLKQLLINQQAQCVDADGRVHALMLHRREDQGFEYPNVTTDLYSINAAAYYHYFRDPLSGKWEQRRIPPEIAPVGSRPTLGYDSSGNLYAAWLTYTDRSQAYPGYRGGYLAIATASKASGYTDWEVVHTSDTRFNGEPLLDQQRLLQNDILSVFIQEDSAGSTAAGTPLHVIDFTIGSAPEFLADPINGEDATENAAYAGTLAGMATDPDDDPLTFSRLSGPSWLAVAPDGTLTGSPAGSDIGANSFTVRATDTHGNSANATLDIQVLAAPPDSDQDGMLDAWEIEMFGNISSQTGTDDGDGDGTDNLTEFRLGLDPNNGTSRFTAILDGSTLRWQGTAGVVFTVQRSTDLSSWLDLSTQDGVTGENQFTDPAPPAGRAWYRVGLGQ